MALSFNASAVPSGNPTTSFTVTIPAGTIIGDVLFLAITSRDATSGSTDVTVTDNDTGGNTWAVVTNTSDEKAWIWWKRATSGTASKTITVSNLVGSGSGVLKVFSGAISTGNPYTDVNTETNASGDETHAAFTPTNDDSMVCVTIHNTGNDNAVTSLAGATLGSLSTVEKLSTGGLDCATAFGHALDAGAPTTTGSITWAQTNGTTYSTRFTIIPAFPIGVDATALQLTEVATVVVSIPASESLAVQLTEVATKADVYLKVELWDSTGPTLIATRTCFPRTIRTERMDLTAGEKASVVNWANLRLKFIANTHEAWVTQAFVEAEKPEKVDFTAVESTAVQLTEAAFTVQAYAAADSIATVLSEASDLLAMVPATESVAVVASEAAALLAQVPATESLAVQVSEQSVLTALVDVSEALGVGLAEAVDILAMLAASESVAVVLSETGEAVVVGGGGDVVAITATDSLAVVIIEESHLRAFLDVAETLVAQLSEQSHLTAAFAVADAVATQIADSGNVAASASASESTGAGVSEAVHIDAAASAADDVRVQLAEAAAVAVLITATDAAALQLSENAAIVVAITAAEAAALGLTELAALMVTASASDAVVVVVEERATIEAAVSAADLVAVAGFESPFVFATVDAAEALGVQLSELADIAIALAASDTAAIVVVEAGHQAESVPEEPGPGGLGTLTWRRDQHARPTIYRIGARKVW